MKKSFIFATIVSLFLFLIFTFVSCSETGLGENVDLEAPVLSVTGLVSDSTPIENFSGGVYCHKTVTFSGEASDNNGVVAVEISVKYGSETSFSYLASASVSGTSWSKTFTFPQEGVAFVKFLAKDAAGNISPKSSKVLTLFVDETAPVANAWYIDRSINGIQYSLHELDYLKNLDASATENKDAFQNVYIKLCAEITEAMGIDEITMSLYDEDGNCVVSGISPDSSSTEYAPTFEVTPAIIASQSYSARDLTSGRNYLQVRYSSNDIVDPTNEVENYEFDGGWFIWWPESDIPQVSPSDLDSDSENTINLHVKNVLSLTVFDDDALSSGSYTLKKSDNTTYSTSNFSCSGSERERVLAITMPDTPDVMTLTVTSSAQSGSTQDSSKTSTTKTYTVNVTDDTTPLLLIKSPSNNTTPAVTMNSENTTATVTVEGESYDTAGCSYLEFVWMPSEFETTSKYNTAKAYLDSLESHSTSGVTTVSSGDYAGLKMWSVSLDSGTSTSGFIKQEFSFNFDLLNDFVYNSNNEKKETKYFLAKLIRNDGNCSYTEYTLTADDNLPSIIGITPSDDMQIMESSSDIRLEFYGSKTSGLAMDTSAYKIELVGYEAELNDAGELVESTENTLLSGTYAQGVADPSKMTYQTVISTELLQAFYNEGVKPKFQFYATDLFGNDGTAVYNIVLSNLPYLKSISTTSSLMKKLGDTIVINAVFSGAVSVTEGYEPYLKLSGISGTADNRDKAYYTSGSGSTTLQFTYTVQEGDSSDCFYVDNTSGSPIASAGAPSLGTSYVHLDTLSQNGYENTTFTPSEKTIQIDGTSPTITGITFTSDATSANVDGNSVTWLKEGRTISARVAVSEAVQIQGTPTFKLAVGSGYVYLPFSTNSNNVVTFSKKIDAEDAQGAVSYIPSSCIQNISVIKDSFGNSLKAQSSSTSTSTAYSIDTTTPAVPVITIENATDNNKYMNSLSFTIDSLASDTSIKVCQYSTDAGSTWNDYDSENGASITTSGQYTLTARRSDWAGNVSEYTDPISVDVNTTFPSFSIDCSNSDGHYKAGKYLTFKVMFASKVKVTDEDSPYIQLSALNSGEVVGAEGSSNLGRAELVGTGSSSSEITLNTEVEQVTFRYEIQDPDEFTLKVAADGVKLTGFKDTYGIEWDSGVVLSEAYERSGIYCDGVAPRISSMEPDGETASSSNIYSNGKKIVLTFNEAVQKSSGYITIRRVAGWAVPPVLTASEFSKITSEITSDQKNILSIQENGIDMEDSESLYQSTVGTANINYHGTGQFVGPYKKTTHGITSSGTPDVSTKYVLDFDMDIWETDTEHYFGKTFTTSGTATSRRNLSNSAYATITTGESAAPKTPSETRTVGQLREVLEAAGYHKRTVSVNSSYVTLSEDCKTVTINFPESLTGEEDLPDGLEWELVIDKKAFMDSTGNYFGAEADGSIREGDAVQKSDGKQYTVYDSGETADGYSAYTGSWARADASSTSPEVLIQTSNGQDSFMSSGVAKPVIRLDRYSYGFGTYQSDENGNRTTYIASDTTEPTGYIRVRIDCETADVTVKYTVDSKTSTPRTDTSGTTAPYYLETSNADCYSYYTSTDNVTDFSSQTLGNTYSSIFAAGNGKYNQSCKQYIIASATNTSLGTSSRGTEGVFQTVVRLYRPSGNAGVSANLAADRNHFSIRGTTGWSGEPYISPFPLRDSQIGSPYLRRCYRNGSDFYWVSYEILVGSSFSGYSWHNSNYYDWCQNWGWMFPGEFTQCVGMRNWN